MEVLARFLDLDLDLDLRLAGSLSEEDEDEDEEDDEEEELLELLEEASLRACFFRRAARASLRS